MEGQAFARDAVMEDARPRLGRQVLRDIGLEPLIDFLETVAYGVCITGDEHTWVYLNEAAERTLGVPLEEVRGADYLHHFPQHERAALLALEANQRAGDTDFYTNTILRPDGSEVEMTWSGTVINVDGHEMAPAIFHETTPVRRAHRNAAQVAAAVHAADGRGDGVLHTLVADAVTATRGQTALLLVDDDGPLRLAAMAGASQAAAAAVDASVATLDVLPGIEELRRGRGLFLSDARSRFQQVSSLDAWVEPLFQGSLGAAFFPVWMDSRVAGCLMVVVPQGVTAPSESELACWSSIADQVSVVLGVDLVRQLTSLSSADSERRRIARDLHDSVSQGLFSLYTRAQVIQRGLAARNDDLVAEAAEDLELLAKQATTQMRELLADLRPTTQDRDLARSLGELAEGVSRREGLPVTVTISPVSLPGLGAQKAEHVHRIVGEALHNAVKHAAASTASLTVTVEGSGLRVSVHDDGRGFDVDEVGAGLGQRTMRERAALCGGELSVTSTPADGTTVDVWVPYTG